MNRIRELREAKGWTQSRLGKELNCTGMTISRYESGAHEVGGDTIGKLCDIFGCTADYLLGRSDNPLPAFSDKDAALLQAYHAAPPSVAAAIATLLQPYQTETKADRAM